MPELNPQQLNEISDIQSKENPKEKGYPLEIAKTPEFKNVIAGLEEIKNSTDHDRSVNLQHLLNVKEQLTNLTVIIGGEKIPINELKNILDLKENMEILNEIKDGNLKHHNNLTFITKDVAEKIIERNQESGIVDGLTKVKKATNEAIRVLAESGKDLFLFKLAILNNTQAVYLGKHNGELHIPDIKQLSDLQMELLSHHHGELNLAGIESLTDGQAESLGKHRNTLILDNLKAISKEGIKKLSLHQGELQLYYLPSNISNDIKNAIEKEREKLGYDLKYDGVILLPDEELIEENTEEDNY